MSTLTRKPTRTGRTGLLLAALLAALLLPGCLAEKGEPTTAPTNGNTANLTWADISSYFSNCTGCHGSSGPDAPPLTSCDGLKNATAGAQGAYVVPGDAAGSVLYQVVEGTLKPSTSITMTLSQSEAADVGSWITNQAPCQ